MKSARGPLSDLLTLVDRGFSARSWHGPNLSGSLRSVSAVQAAWRPHAGRHNIWEVAVHAAFWKYRVVRLLSPQPPIHFELKGSNWFPRPFDCSEHAWREDRQLLATWHKRLRSAVAQLNPSSLDRKVGKSRYTRWDFVTGAVAHDVYHAGQIQLLTRLLPR